MGPRISVGTRGKPRVRRGQTRSTGVGVSATGSYFSAIDQQRVVREREGGVGPPWLLGIGGELELGQDGGESRGEGEQTAGVDGGVVGHARKRWPSETAGAGPEKQRALEKQQTRRAPPKQP